MTGTKIGSFSSIITCYTDDGWKGNSCNGNGNSKDNSGSGNIGNNSGNGTGSKKGILAGLELLWDG